MATQSRRLPWLGVSLSQPSHSDNPQSHVSWRTLLPCFEHKTLQETRSKQVPFNSCLGSLGSPGNHIPKDSNQRKVQSFMTMAWNHVIVLTAGAHSYTDVPYSSILRFTVTLFLLPLLHNSRASTLFSTTIRWQTQLQLVFYKCKNTVKEHCSTNYNVLGIVFLHKARAISLLIAR